MFIPSSLDICSNASVQLSVTSPNHIHKPIFCGHAEKPMPNLKAEVETQTSLNISNIQREFRDVAIRNGWQGYHNPKNLAAAISVEAAELLAEFQWLTAEESSKLNSQQRAQVSDEVADVIMYLTELCAQLDINITDAVEEKIRKNKERFKN